MKGYFHIVQTEACPLGQLGQMRRSEAWLYDPVSDDWVRWEQGDALGSAQGPQVSYDRISDEDGDYLKYNLRIAEELTHMFGNDYHDGRNFIWVKECQK